MTSTQPCYFIHTWGCQMNEDDSRQIANILDQLGYHRASEESDADLILLNTCSVRARPEQKMRTKLGELRLMKLDRHDLIIGVCGCTAQKEGEALLKGRPYIDFILGTASIYDLPTILQEVKQEHRRLVRTDIPDRGGAQEAAHVTRSTARAGLKVFVPAMYGCNNFCAYCVVPYTRGPERSRPHGEIVAEVSELTANGCREITLVGQNVNSYGRTLEDETDFAGLLDLLNDVKGLERIRFMTSHPKSLSGRLIEAMADLPKVCEHLHLPLQSGDNSILEAMGRGYTVEHYRSLVDRLRERLPDIALTTDFIVGFPGEGEEEFENTMQAIERIRFDSAYTFMYSPRPGTRAASMEDNVDKKTKSDRLCRLIELQNAITLEKNSADIGKVFEVLVESPSAKDPSRMTGNTRTGKTVNFPGHADLSGRLVNVRATSGHVWGYSGERF